MELEGFGVSLVGRSTWVYADTRTHPAPVVPWEFLQCSYAMRLLVTERSAARLRFAEAEMDWTCVWTPTTPRDWSGIATVLRSTAQVGPCLLVLDRVEPSQSFWSYLEGLRKEGRSITLVWIHSTPPIAHAWVPDALFVPPTPGSHAEALRALFATLPERGGHGRWFGGGDVQGWADLVAATHEQGLGLVLTDIEEPTWTLLWHRPSDSRLSLEKRVPGCVAWIQTGTYLLGANGV
jgi:hypothetical protein